MLSVLEDAGSVEQAAEKIAERHGVELATVQTDMCALCEQLAERGLITVESA
jgi:hypothetical protein